MDDIVESDIDWDSYFLKLCDSVAVKSKDFSKKVGAIITTPSHENIMSGYNGIPKFLKDKKYRFLRPEKYNWTVHAEMNCIDIAARTGTKLEGGTLYCNYYPCKSCALHIVNVGIKKVVTYKKPDSPEYIDYGFDLSEEMFLEAKIEIVEL